MKTREMKVIPIQRLQSVLFYVFAIWFALVMCSYVVGFDYAKEIAVTGVVALLVSIPVRVIFMAEQFRRAHLSRFALLSYLIIVIMLGAVIYKYLLS